MSAISAGGRLRLLAVSLATWEGSPRWISPEVAGLCRRVEAGEPLTGEQEELERRIRTTAERLVAEGTTGAGRRVPSRHDLGRMLAFAAGTDLPASYLPRLEEELELVPARAEWRFPAGASGFRVAVIGAGVSGIAMALRLKEDGVPFVILESNADVGGTWFVNTYPDCGVDTPAHLYAFADALNPEWSAWCPKRAELLTYIKDVVEQHGLREHLRTGVHVDAARYDELTHRWRITMTTRDGATEDLVVNAVVCSVGALSQPKYPEIPGIEEFAGAVMHTARWRHDVEPAGRRVGIVGNGSSGVQVARALAATGSSLTVFQRSPAWIAPNPMAGTPLEEDDRWCLRNVPYYLRWHRFVMNWELGDANHPKLLIDRAWPGPGPSELNDRTRRELAAYVAGELPGRPDLVEGLVPDYPPYVKRLVIDNEWYRTLALPTVRLVRQGLVGADATGVVTAGGEHIELDVLVLATGFQGTRFLWPMEVRGRAGLTPADVFGGDEEVRAHLGVTMPGFPNLFMLTGPNSGLGHGGSIVHIAEAQAYLTQTWLRYLLDSGGASIEITERACAEFNAELDRGLAGMVWGETGVRSRYKTERGRIAANHPWTFQSFWDRTRSFDPAEVRLCGRLDAGTTEGMKHAR